jgi:diadenosine tetraphosphate (Ap4A) HIT family hydrolase
MKDPNCFYCEDGEKRRSLMKEICKIGNATLYLNRDQKHKGRCVLKYEDHVTDISKLTVQQNQVFFESLRQVAAALEALFSPDKINYAIYGDTVPHLHVHIVPKYKGGLQWGGPFDDSVPRQEPSEEEVDKLINMIRGQLQKQHAI